MRFSPLGPLVIVTALAAGCSTSVPQQWPIDRSVDYYSSIKIDSSTLHVQLVGKSYADMIPDRDYYVGDLQLGSGDDSVIAHRRGNPDGTYDEIETIRVKDDSQLSSRRRQMGLLRGDFGLVATDLNYRYGIFERGQGATFQVSSAPSFLHDEQPREVDHISRSNLTLDAVSLVRVIQSDTIYIVASADYRPSGEVSGLHVYGRASGGEEVRPDDERLTGVGVTCGVSRFFHGSIDSEARIEFARLGIPESFFVDEYLAGDRAVFDETDLSVALEAVHLHYNHSHVVHQDILKSSAGPSIKYLTFEVTPLDQALQALDISKSLNSISPPR